MAGRRVTRRGRNPIPPPPLVEENSHENPKRQENQNVVPPEANDQANLTNLPAPPTDLATMPKEYNGKPADPLWPAHWIDEMERYFMMMTVNEEEKMLCATFMRKGNAHHWWKSTQNYLLTKHAQLTWAIYKEAFFEKYFSRIFRDAMEESS
ncbi:hypothetical protein NE237_022579 [Protea cynaroides]|uniref:Retrotransposon gag domain-containing protein n=1 Tax=Protea cynaroides TaxID=273540 RepID=A0A9Q0HB99_9MAGN|nr:hypothetical protein NE237_022579 [Protea cynaroides]